MKTLKRSECAVLPLVLKDKWFDMIALGQKKEEYRARGGYWDTRIRNWFDRAEEACVPLVVEFRRGYAARAQRTAFLLDSLLIRMLNRFLHPDWGEPQGEHYVLCLGERVKLEEGDGPCC